jgi:hypothetical protein
MKFQGRILARLPGRREVDRRGERLPSVWVREAKESALPMTSTLVRDSERAPPLSPAPDTLIVMLSGDCPAAVQMLLAAARSGARVYVLAPPGWGEGEATGPLADVPRATVLVRRVRDLPATAVWSADGAWLWTGAAATRPSWRLALTTPQGQALRLAMLRLFWHHGLDEAWNQSGLLAFRPCGDRPYDVPDAASDALVRLVSRSAAETPLVGESIYLPFGSSHPKATVRAWVPASGHDHAGLSVLRTAGAEVVWRDLDLPACGIDGEQGSLRAGSAQWSLSVTLDAAQRSDLKKILASEPSWRFQMDAPLGEIERLPGAVVWLPGATESAPLRTHEKLEAGETPADSLRECATTEPGAMPAPSPLSLRVEWAWRVLPPRRPVGATDDPLVRSWRELDAAFKRRLDAARTKVDGVEARTSGLASTFETLRAAMLGFGRKRSDLAVRIERLAATAPSVLGAEQAPGALAELRAIEIDATALSQALDADEHRAREERERDEQRAAFEESATRTRAALERHQSERRTKLADLSATEGTIAQMGEGVADGGSEKDRKVALRKHQDDQQSLRKRLLGIDALIADCEQKLSVSFEYRPSVPVAATVGKRPGVGAFVPAAGSEDELRAPDTSLPSVGRLMSSGKQRFLGIQIWEELDAAEREAVRLAARLVAEVEGP